MILIAIPFVITLFFIAVFGFSLLQRGDFIYGVTAYLFASSLVFLPLSITGFILNIISLSKHKLTVFHVITIILCCLCVVTLIIGAFTIKTFDF